MSDVPPPCQPLSAQVQGLRGRVQAAQNELQREGNPGNRGAMLEQIRELESELVASQKALENCIRANSLPPAKPVAAVAPQAILSVQYVNPPPPDERNANWATSIVGGTSTFPQDTHNGVIHTDSYAPVNSARTFDGRCCHQCQGPLRSRPIRGSLPMTPGRTL